MKSIFFILLSFLIIPSTTHGDWQIAVISDMNKSYGSTQYTSELKAAIRDIQLNGVDLVVSTGDMVAGQKSGLNYRAMWDAFNIAVTGELANSEIPFLPSPGNHDASAGRSFQREREFYKQNFSAFPVDRYNPVRSADRRVEFVGEVEQNFPLNYAVTMGPAVFVALDATNVGALINDQLGWLDEVLTATKESPVKIVFGHMPLYPFAFTKASEHMAVSAQFVEQMENLLERHRVTYFLSGHHHVFYPGHRRGSVRYVSVPLLGSGKRKLLTKNREVRRYSEEGFLYISFNSKGEHSLEAVESPSLNRVQWESLPSAVSLPSSSANDCKHCGSFPLKFFLNSSARSLYERLNSL